MSEDVDIGTVTFEEVEQLALALTTRLSFLSSTLASEVPSAGMRLLVHRAREVCQTLSERIAQAVVAARTEEES